MPEGAREEDPRYPGWRVVAASGLALAFGPSTIAVLSLGLFMRSFETDFHWARTQVALATSIVSYMIVVVSPLQGWLTDRLGARRVILWSIPLFGAGVAALSLLPPVLWIYYAAWVVIPLLGTGLFPLAYLKVVGSWFNRHLGLALGLANAGVAAGSLVLPLIVGGLIGSYGWRNAYLGLAAIVLFFTWPLAVFGVRESGSTADAPKPALSGFEFGEAVRTRTFLLLSLVFLLVGVATTALIVHQVPLLTDRGMLPREASMVQAVFGLFGLIGRLITGVLLDKWRATRVMTAFVLGGAMSCVLYAAGTSGNGAFLCSALIGLLFGAEFDVLAYIIKRQFGLKAFGKLYGLAFALFQFGAGFGTAILPMTRDHFGSYSVGLGAFAVLLALAAVVLSRIPDHETRAT